MDLGVGLGVSFSAKHSPSLGAFITATLAIHNIPEGLAVSIRLCLKKTKTKQTPCLF